MSYQLTEIAVNAVTTQIRDNIVAALASVNAARGDNLSNLLRPQEYFIFPTRNNYRKPALFVVAQGFVLRQEEKGSNFISGFHDLSVSVVLEDRLESMVTRACWRYQAALTQVLHLVQLAGPGDQTKMVVRVTDMVYSPIWTEASEVGDVQSVFCKEVGLGLQVEHYEPFQ